MKPSDLYLDAEQAAKALNVTVATLYAYVSRKMIRSERVEGSRKRLYWRADIERLCGQAATTGASKAQAAPVSDSAITLITDGGLFYRGQDAIALARTCTIESLAALLWQADEAALFGTPLVAPPELWARLRPMLDGLSTYEQAIASFPLVERLNPQAYDLSKPGYARTGADVMRWYASLLSRSERPVTQPLHKHLAKALKAPPGFDEVIRTTMVLAADHEFDAMTFAVRAIANLGVTPYQAVTVGLIASQGQRFLLERLGSAARFLREIVASGGGAAAVVQRLRQGEPLPGFSHSTAPADPRGGALMQALKACVADEAEFQRLAEAEAMVQEATGATIDFILPLAFVGHRLGLHGNELGIAGVGRIVGWVAHSMEQLHSHERFRPRATYVGQLPKEVPAPAAY